ncbi:MAG: hypothetical protein HC939_19015 [Pleurocapsa sp. SU_5_0]|nr:hypothetical protein [Pleurocapsa sp. SU_5_0]
MRELGGNAEVACHRQLHYETTLSESIAFPLATHEYSDRDSTKVLSNCT